MRRLLVAGMLVLAMCSLTGCGQDERIENAQEQAIGLQDDARDAVEDYNEQVQDIEESAQTIETEFE